MRLLSLCRKGIVGALTICACATPLVVSAPAVTFASENVGDGDISLLDNVDRDFEFNFSLLGTTDGSTIQKKHNSSSTYVYLDAVNISAAQLYVDGRAPGSVAFHNCMGGADAVVNSNLHGQYCIRNLVYERYGAMGYAEAQLTGWGMGNSGSIVGKWSPDSMRTYTPLNGYCNPNIW